MADVDRSWTGITREQFRRAVESLPADSRSVFQLRAYGQPYQEIAAQLAISREAVGARLRQARAQLRDALLTAVLS